MRFEYHIQDIFRISSKYVMTTPVHNPESRVEESG